MSSATLFRIFGKSPLFLASAPFFIWKGKATELSMSLQKLLGFLICLRFGKGLFQALLSILWLRNYLCNALACSLLYFNFSSMKFTYFLSKKKKNLYWFSCHQITTTWGVSSLSLVIACYEQFKKSQRSYLNQHSTSISTRAWPQGTKSSCTLAVFSKLNKPELADESKFHH